MLLLDPQDLTTVKQLFTPDFPQTLAVAFLSREKINGEGKGEGKEKERKRRKEGKEGEGEE